MADRGADVQWQLARLDRARGPVVLLAALALLPLLASAASGQASNRVEERGYITMSDGVELRYTAYLPADRPGPFPVLLQYDGYAAGTNPYENGQAHFGPRMLAQGFAVVGVSIRGTGCSEGRFDFFSEQWIDDAEQIVDWLANAPWSNGRVGMFGASWPGIMQLMASSSQPPQLDAIAPAVPIADLYREGAYPGGIYNTSFFAAWTAIRMNGYPDVPGEVARGDINCASHVPEHNDTENVVAVQMADAEWDDHPVYERFLPPAALRRVRVPMLLQGSWQDEQISSGRGVYDALDQFNPSTTWAVLGNGHHPLSVTSDKFQDLQERFFLHFLADEDNGFDRMPHVQIWHEVDYGSSPAWVSGYQHRPQPEPVALHLHPDGGMGLQAPSTAGTADYRYPAPAPSLLPYYPARWAARASLEGTGLEALGDQLDHAPPDESGAISYKAPVPPDGAAVYTTAPLAHDTELLGPASADVWISSEHTDTDLQVTLTEVRPDGNELYLQRGWLRASHRAIDRDRSTPLRPIHPHIAAAVEPMPSNEPALVRIEVHPFAHVLREGSSLRLYIEAPLGFTGFRQLDLLTEPGINTVHTGAATPSRLTIGWNRSGRAQTPLPACDSLQGQPCRSNPHPVPTGTLDLPAAAGGTAEEGNSTTTSRPTPKPTAATSESQRQRTLPATGAGTGLPGLALWILASTTWARHRYGSASDRGHSNGSAPPS